MNTEEDSEKNMKLLIPDQKTHLSEQIHQGSNILTKDRVWEEEEHQPFTINPANSNLSHKEELDYNMEKRSSNQFRALFLKSASVQSKRMGTNCCQIFTPLICLILVLIIEKLAESQWPSTTLSMQIPLIFNVPQFYNLFAYDNLPITMSTCLQWYSYDFDKSMTPLQRSYVEDTYDGLFTHILSNYSCVYVCHNDTTWCEKTVPFFQKPQWDLSINQELYNDLIYLNTQPFKRWQDMPGLDVLPDGSILFKEASDKKLSFRLQVNDLRLPEYHRNNGITKIQFKNGNQSYSAPTLTVANGQLSILDLVSRAYLHKTNPNVWLISGVQYMPLEGQDKSWIMRIINITGASLYPLALSLLLPVFMYVIVLEKEERLIEMMKMNGMRMRNYWSVTYLFDFLLYLVAFLIFVLFGYFVLELSFFTETNIGLLILILIGWGLSQISMAFFFQVFIAKARTATIIGYLLSIWTIITAVSFNVGVYPDPYQLPYGLRLYPPFAFCRLIYLLSIACSNQVCYKTFEHLTEEIKSCLYLMYIGAVVFLILGIYLHEVIPQEYGLRKHPLFCLKSRRKRKSSTNDKGYEHVEASTTEVRDPITKLITDPEIQKEIELEDQDARAEREFVYNIDDRSYGSYPLVTKNLRKVYKSSGGRPNNVAVKSLSMSVRPGEIFGLLGPNGAGKTTLISMITGFYPPDQGNAWIAGSDILENIEKVHLQMGVCPQFDLLWPDLTVEEHLLFYARLKGASRSEEKSMTERALREVYLTDFRAFKTRELSGGMKRRLSVAISLVGDPKIIFLDEPTTGLDPDNRRKLWDILVESKGKRAMVLTTHSMEEADVLCSRIGIITNGVLRCIGPQVRLKSLYGRGYHLYVNCHKERFFNQMAFFEKDEEGNQKKLKTMDAIVTMEWKSNLSNQGIEQSRGMQVAKNVNVSISTFYEKAITFIKTLLPRANLVSSFNGNFIFQVPLEGLEVSKLFDELENKKGELMISDWGISQSSLEDVFMQIVDTS